MRAPFVCDRVRSQLSLQLDGELSQLERAMVVRHLRRCAGCQAFQINVAAFTQALREAPAETMEVPVVVAGRPRRIVARLQVGVAAALAIAALGVTSQVIGDESQSSTLSSLRGEQLRFQSERQLAQELALLQIVQPGVALPRGSRQTVR